MHPYFGVMEIKPDSLTFTFKIYVWCTVCEVLVDQTNVKYTLFY